MGAAEPKPPVAVGDLVAGKYAVERVVGSGGMGVVMAARHIHLDQRVALKFLHSHVLNGEQASARFLREARATVRLKSDHVARVYDVDKLPSGAPYAVMELLEGVDLANYARSRGPLRIADAVEFVIQACEGIIEAHALGIIHRDLKPQNLFVTTRVNGALRIKVLDFGISKSLGGSDMSLTDSSVVLGSPLYMSPEQMKASRNVDARSDIWSLGVILFELLTGKLPFDGTSITELCLNVVTGEPPLPRALRADIPEALAAIVARCLEKDPKRRFQSVASLAGALEPFSASSERGGVDRTWQSMADTADSIDARSLPSASPEPRETPPGSNTGATWGNTAEFPAASKRRYGFARGLVAGLGVAAIAVTGLLLTAGKKPSVKTSEAPVTASELQGAAVAPAEPASAIDMHRAEPSASGAPAVSSSPPASAPAASGVAATPVPDARTGKDAAVHDPRMAKPSARGRAAHTTGSGSDSAETSASNANTATTFRTTANGSPILP